MRFRLALALSTLLMAVAPAGAQMIPPSPVSIDVVDSGTACVTAPHACATWQIPNNAPSVTIQSAGTMTSLTLTVEATADGQTWFSIAATKLSTGVAATTITATGQYAVLNSGLLKLRLRCTTYASGQANVTLTRGSSSQILYVSGP